MQNWTEEDLQRINRRLEESEEDDDPQAKKRVRGVALTRLCKASARTVRNHSSEIVASLYKGVLEGDVSCAKMLVTLIEKLPPPKPREKKRPSIALLLENSPQWTRPLPSEQDDPHEYDEVFEDS